MDPVRFLFFYVEYVIFRLMYARYPKTKLPSMKQIKERLNAWLIFKTVGYSFLIFICENCSPSDYIKVRKLFLIDIELKHELRSITDI